MTSQLDAFRTRPLGHYVCDCLFDLLRSTRCLILLELIKMDEDIIKLLIRTSCFILLGKKKYYCLINICRIYKVKFVSEMDTNVT